MNVRESLKRILALVMAFTICFSIVPWSVLAEESASYTRISSMDELTTGTYVLVASNGYAPGTLDGTWITAADFTAHSGDTITDAQGAVWTVTVSGSTAMLTDSNGISIAPKGGNSNGISSGEYSWAVTCESGAFAFAGQGEDTVVLASNAGSENKFRAYKTATVSSNPNGYPSTFTLYKLDEAAGEEPSEEPTEETTEPAVTVPTVADGTYLLWQADSGKAMSAHAESYNYGYAPAADVTVADGVPSGHTNNEIYTITNTADGKFTITDAYGRQLYMSGTYNSFNLAAAPESGNEWYLTDAGNGTYNVNNAEMGKYIQYTSYGNFGAYDYANGEGKLTLIAVTPVEETPEETTPEETEPEEMESVVWEKVELADITAEDVVAITMTKDDTTWVLPNVAEGTKGQPLASYTGAIDGDKLTTDVEELYSWTITAAEGGYTIMAGESYLYITADNNGMRIGTTAAVWNVEEGYLASVDSKGDTRYMGVYNSTDWRCYKNTTGNTAGQTLGFWKLVAEETEEEPAAPVIADGTYVIWEAANGKAATALGETYTYGYMKTVDVALEGDKLTGYGETEAFTVTNLEDGTFTITDAYGRYLYMSGSYNSFNVSTELPESGHLWTAVANGDGTVKLMNVEKAKYVSYDTAYGSYGVYAEPTDAQLDDLTLTAYEAPAEETPGIADGDYVIWAPAYNKALSSEKTGNYNVGVDVTLENEILSGYSAAEIWTVTNNEDGTITITQNGSKLSMADSYSSLTMDGVNDTWTLVSLEGGLYNVQNVGRGNYLEWYDKYSNWSTYNSSSAATDGQFQIMFTPAVVEEEPAGIADGDYVIWAPAYNVTVANSFNGSNYQLGTPVTPVGDDLVGYSAIDIWTVTNNEDGTVSISQNGAYLGGTSGSLTIVGAEGDYAKWNVIFLESGDCYLQNVGNSKYLEWYATYSDWTLYSFYESSADLYTLRFTPAELVYNTDSEVVNDIAQWSGAYTEEAAAQLEAYGDKYVSGDKLDTDAVLTVVAGGTQISPYYLPGANGYMGGTGIGAAAGDYIQLAVNTAGWGDMTLAFRMRATKTAPGEFRLTYSTDGGVTWKNFNTGSYAYAFTQYTSDGQTAVTGSGDITDGVARTSLAATYYVSFSFDVPSGAENCENLLIRLVPGDTLANGNVGPAGSTSTIRMDSVVLSGSPIVDDAVAGYVTVTPDGSEDQALGTELTMTAEEGAAIYYRVNGGEWLTYDESSKPTLDSLPCDIEVYASVEGKADSAVLLYHYAAGTVAVVKMNPNGGGVYIAGESETLTLTTATEGATIYYMTSADNEVWPENWTEYTEPLTLAKGFGKLYVKAYAVKEGYTDSKVATRTFTERTTDSYQLYFGQLHSHTNISDGAGSVEEAFAYAYNANNLDFLAVTDHSNSFDNADSGVISEDGSAVSEEWALGHEMAEKYTDDTFVGLYGYEMTWSNGLGHMNTFNTPGWQSRTQSAYTSYGTALQNYYDALTTVSDSISMFNHPGTTFGDFSDFAHYTEAYDDLITLIEVGNGEGAIGSSGYFPSYEYYTRALDKGWHVAPANNQDNHKGLWGNANTGRTVVLADSLTAEGIYDALRNYRVYATEDHDLNIYYTLNGNTMGSILDLDTGDALTLVVTLSDYSDAAIGKVEVIVNGGLTAASTNVEANSETVTFTLSNEYSYYYIKVTEADGDIAVTAPVWTGEVEACGISTFETDAALPVQNQEMNLTLELYNNEANSLQLDSIVFTIGDEVIHTADLTNLSAVKPYGTGSYTFPYTHTGLGQTEIYVTVTGTLNGVTKVYQEKLDLTYVLADMVTRVVVDGTHYNDYVTGYYGGNMNNLTSIAAESQIEVNVVTDQITPEILADCDLLIISAPARFSGTANAGAYVAKPFEDSFIELVKNYVEAGGSVIVCGLADYQDKKAASDDLHAAAQLNKLLAAIGSTMRINDDEAYDEENNGGQAYRLYPEIFNTDSQWCAGIAEGQTYSQYSGCTVDVGSGTWLVKGFETTYSIDSDNDGLGGINKGEAVFMAVEETSYGGNIFVAGGVFVSDFEVKAELDNIWDLPYANRTIIENIMGAVRAELPLSTISEVRAAEEGEVFRIRGYVTAGTDNEYNTFFDAIYVQDETGGITVFPFAQSGVAIGTPIEIIGYVDAYQGDKEIQVMSYTILDAEAHVYEPEKMSNADAMDYAVNGGELIQVEGEVVEVITSGGNGVSQFVVKDEKGDLAKVFIDGYILSGTTGKNELAEIVKVGNTVSAVGLSYMHPEGNSEESVAVLRVRDCDEVVLIAEKEPDPAETTKPGSGSNANTGDGSMIGLVIGIMGVSLVLVVVLLVLMLKKKGKK